MASYTHIEKATDEETGIEETIYSFSIWLPDFVPHSIGFLIGNSLSWLNQLLLTCKEVLWTNTTKIFLGMSILALWYSLIATVNIVITNWILNPSIPDIVKAILSLEWIIIGMIIIGVDPITRLLMTYPKQNEV